MNSLLSNMTSLDNSQANITLIKEIAENKSASYAFNLALNSLKNDQNNDIVKNPDTFIFQMTSLHLIIFYEGNINFTLNILQI